MTVLERFGQVANGSLSLQCRVLGEVLLASNLIGEALDTLRSLSLPDAYLGAGAVVQTVWNAAHDYEPHHAIRDLDVVYFDSANLTATGEEAVEASVRDRLAHVGTKIDVTNEARVHLWYEDRFGKSIPPYESTCAAIATWPTTASCVGVRLDEMGAIDVCAPFGLHDLFSLVVRPNKRLVSEAVYTA